MSAPSPPLRLPGTAAVLAVLAVLLVALGGYGLARASDGVTVRHVTVAGVPMTEVRAAAQADVGRRPGVVVAHGFAGSARLMRPLADTVARDGMVALLLDFAGHGANPGRLGGGGRGVSDRTLAADLDVAVAHLRGLPDVDPERIHLVGHSMGAGAVTRWAADHPEILRTVAISLPDAGDAAGARPADLLLIVGGAEFPDFRRAAEEAAGQRGSTRRLVVVPGVEHISVLFAARTHDEVAAWLPSHGGSGARPTARLLPAGLLLLGVGLGFVPLTVLALGRRPARPRPPAPSPGWLLGVAVVAAGVGAVVAAVVPTARLPLAVGGHVTGFLLVSGLLLAVAGRWSPPRAAAAPLKPGPAAPVAHLGRARSVVAAVLLTGYAVLAVAVPIHLGLTSALPVGARWWLLPVVAIGSLVFLAGAERVSGGRTARHAVVGVIAVLALTASAVAGLAPGFVLLVVPLFALLVVWQVAWAAVLRRAGAPSWLPPVVGAALLGWPVATTLPLT
ncbi:dienelactone hydrolase family protein [Micromonospora sp. BQ11]|uniref:dienelactone hydrolase family protein n=1 Tax=Micromonospora sp. BQ11 TaxID=3452212 RepID=UPI003F8A47F7